MSEVLTLSYGYTAKDLAAVRAYVQRVAPAIIARTYYDPDEDSFAATPAAMERHLRTMLDGLVKVAIEQGSPALADHLRASVRKHGEPKLTAVTFRMVTEAATLAAASPHASHSIGRWFRPRVTSRLKGEGIATIGELIAFCNRRGGSWWRSIPRIGAGRAAIIVAWLRRHETQLGLRVDVDVNDGNCARDPLVAAEVVQVRPAGSDHVDAGGAGQLGGASVRLTLAPLERMAVPHALSGGDGPHRGENRSVAFCYIQARHDLDAVRAYLNRYRDQPQTLRAYTKELERFLLWSVVVRGKALSSLGPRTRAARPENGKHCDLCLHRPGCRRSLPASVTRYVRRYCQNWLRVFGSHRICLRATPGLDLRSATADRLEFGFLDSSNDG
ncbi:MAG: hypothetical protein QOF42_967 [Gammaproteobacteria bacterium]|nr:hypothetical protein [Gammaproteobacteria bacterium]